MDPAQRGVRLRFHDAVDAGDTDVAWCPVSHSGRKGLKGGIQIQDADSDSEHIDAWWQLHGCEGCAPRRCAQVQIDADFPSCHHMARMLDVRAGGRERPCRVMGLSPARISIATEPPNAVVRIVGRAAVERARDFDIAVRRLVEAGVRDVYLDLRDCPLLDSTFSGTLALLAEESLGAEPMVRFTLLDAKARIVDGLANLEVLPFLSVAAEGTLAPVTEEAVELPVTPASHRETGEICLNAHRALMALSPSNQSRFRELETMLSQELEKGPGQ